jgi:hypothetical protein
MATNIIAWGEASERERNPRAKANFNRSLKASNNQRVFVRCLQRRINSFNNLGFQPLALISPQAMMFVIFDDHLNETNFNSRRKITCRGVAEVLRCRNRGRKRPNVINFFILIN